LATELVCWYCAQAHKAGLQHSFEATQLPLDQLKHNVKTAIQQYRLLKKDPNRRDTWLGQLIDAQAQATGKKRKQLWQQIQSQEWIKLMVQQVKFALGKVTQHRPLAIVNEPTPTNTRRDCTTWSALKTACLAEAGRWFTQANQTPCFKSPIWEIFGELGVRCKAFDQILDGTFTIPSSCDQFTKKVLEHLKRPSMVRPIPQPSLAEYMCGWRQS